VTECLVLAALGCAGGVALGWAGLRVFVALRPATLDELASARMDAATLWVALALSALTGVLFGLVGAHASRRSSHEALKAGATNLTQGRQHHRLRSLLVVSEMAISATLLVGATLLVRSVVHLQLTDPGFDVRGLYGVRVSLPRSRYPAAGPRAGFYAELARRAGALPGVRGVTLAAGSPGTSNFLIGALQVDDEPTPGPGITSFVDYNAIEPNYFAVTGQRLVQGTTFTDSSATSGQVVVNEGLARRRWRNASALGHRVRVALNGQGEWRTVVGVAADARMGGLTTESSKPMLYLPRNDGSQLQLIVRTSSETTILPALRHLVGEIDPHLPPPEIVGAARVMASSVAGPRFTMILLTIFTLLAVLLAAVGLYGVMAYAVAQRVREIGIRIALGATRRAIAGDVAATGLAISVTGGSLGLLGGWWAARFLDRMLYGVSRTDIMSFIVGGGVLFGASLLACLVPMSRAAGVDPAIAMRAE
jgi:predicted permease